MYSNTMNIRSPTLCTMKGPHHHAACRLRKSRGSDSSATSNNGRFVAFLRFFVFFRRTRFKGHHTHPNMCDFEHKGRVFGCNLLEHLSATGDNIPQVLKCCAEYIERRGLVDGIYRLSGVISNIQRLRLVFEDEDIPDLNDERISQDIHCVASLLKLYFRELPDPLLTYKLYDKFVHAMQPNYPNEVSIASDSVLPEAKKVENLKLVIRELPELHRRTLEYLTRHLSRVASHGARTGMTAKNVAIVWAPNLLRCQNIEAQSGIAALQLIGIQAVITEYLIRYADVLFKDDEEEEELTSESMDSINSISVSSKVKKGSPLLIRRLKESRPNPLQRRCHSYS
ncbi:GTPase-activating protein CdGAPr [Halotydeus destructor]|nr:GTPase-activating protein CdGAPr [Halotydeus destructor]